MLFPVYSATIRIEEYENHTIWDQIKYAIIAATNFNIYFPRSIV